MIERLNLASLEALDSEALRFQIRQIISGLIAEESIPLSERERTQLEDEVLNETFGLGPIEPYLHDPDVSDILVNTSRQVYVERFGKLDTVVNGAAGNFLAPAAGLSPNGFRTVVDIDLNGTFNTSRAAFEALQHSGDAMILNISATLHYHGTPLQIHASAAKAGVDAITRNLAVEWGGFGIRVCGIAPGPIADTEGMRRLAPGEITDKMKAAIPAGRFGAIDEIAAAAVFLRSPAGAYITGHTLVVDGGHCIAPPRVGFTP